MFYYFTKKFIHFRLIHYEISFKIIKISLVLDTKLAQNLSMNFVRRIKIVNSSLFQKHLLITNTCICGFGSFISDISAQTFEHLIEKTKVYT